MSYSAKSKIIFMGPRQPFTCDVCKFVLRDLEDMKSVKEHTACTNCVTNFKHINLEKWKKGWRPTVREARST